MTFKDLARRGLVFKRLLEIASALAQSISRAFSIAITACAAKFWNRAICLSENGPDFPAVDDDEAEQGVVFAQGNAEQGARAT